MKLQLRDGTERVEIDKLPAWLLVDALGWIDVYYDEESANDAKKGVLEGGTDCTIYVLERND